MKKGINQWCFPKGYSIDDSLKLAAQAGFHTVELNVTEDAQAICGREATILHELGLDDNTGLTTATSQYDVQHIVSTAAQLHLTLPSLSTGLHWVYPLSSNETTLRNRGIQIVIRMLELAKDLGADTILIVAGVVDPMTSYRQAWNNARSALRDLASEASHYGVHMAIENVWNKFLLSPLEVVRFLDDIQSEWVSAYMDVGNILAYGFPEQWIRELGSRIRKVHVKDFRYDIGTIRGFTPLLQGDVAWDRVMDALSEVGYDGPLTAEVAPYPTAPEQLIYDTSAALDRILALRTPSV